MKAANFIIHNKRVFPRINKNIVEKPKKIKKHKKSIVLFELNTLASSIISYSYLADVLSDEWDVDILAYFPEEFRGFRKLFDLLNGWLNPLSTQRIYKSFGISRVIAPVIQHRHREKAKALLMSMDHQLNSKSGIENIEINGIWVGDLVYDSYLRKFGKPTINPSSPHFRSFLEYALSLLVFWEDYFDRYDVKAVNVSHCAYILAIPLRIAISRGIPAYQTNATSVYRLDKENIFAYTDFKYFPSEFKALSFDQKRDGIAAASQRINRRFSGEVGVDMVYSSKSAYGSIKQDRVISESDRKKILVATHCFFDSPHGYGKNLFPDFYDWLNFLGQVSCETNYDWYLKTHPDYLAGTMAVIEGFLDKYSEFSLIPASTSHHQIISEGIDVALTVYGTIGFEYAALGIPVINASINNPHIAYNFNFHPSSVKEYRYLLLNLNEVLCEFESNPESVQEFYFMQHIFNFNDWLFSDYEKMIHDLGGYQKQFTSDAYDYWIRSWSESRHNEILRTLKNFVCSSDFRLYPKHLA
jgi:hypothetical protein